METFPARDAPQSPALTFLSFRRRTRRRNLRCHGRQESHHRTVLLHWGLALRGSSLRENTIPEKRENKILPGWISVSSCDSEDSAFGVGMTRSGRPFLATDNTRDFSISIRLA